MRSKSMTIVVTTLTLLAFGCSESSVRNAKRVVDQPASALNATLPTTAPRQPVVQQRPSTAPLKTPQATLPPMPFNEGIEGPGPHLQSDQQFNGQGLSNVVLPVVKRQTTDDGTTLQLLGFVSAKGLQSLLAEDGKLHVVGLGESSDGAQIVAVEAPAVTLQDSEHEVDLSIFQQQGFHDVQQVFAASRETLGGEAITPGVGGGLPGAMPGLAGGMPGFPGGEGLPGGASFPGFPSEAVNGLPGIPGFKTDGSPADLPGFPGANHEGGEGIPGLPGVGGLPGREANTEIPGLPNIDAGSGHPTIPGVGGGANPARLPSASPLSDDLPGFDDGDVGIPGLEEALPGLPTDTNDDVTSND